MQEYEKHIVQIKMDVYTAASWGVSTRKKICLYPETVNFTPALRHHYAYLNFVFRAVEVGQSLEESLRGGKLVQPRRVL